MKIYQIIDRFNNENDRAPKLLDFEKNVKTN